MIAANDITNASAIGERFVAAIAKQDWTGLESCLATTVRFRALVPRGLREASDSRSTAEYFSLWFGDADQLEVVTSEVQLIQNRLHIRYQLSIHKDDWYVIEQQVYCDVPEGYITGLDLLCSGFQPRSDRGN